MPDLAVIFPGIGYTCDKPLLYYARKLALNAGYNESHILIYDPVDKAGLMGNSEKMKEVFLSLYESAEKDLSKIEWEKYDRILFISKSIGTVVATAYENKLLSERGSSLPPIKQILFTPLEETFSFQIRDAIAFIGNADPWSNNEKVIESAGKQNVPIEVYEGANHSLETGDIAKDLEYLKNALEICRKYLES